MTTAARRPDGGHYRLRHVARMEWTKLRTLRSTWWTLAITVGGATAMAVTIGVNTRNGAGDLTNNALAGVVPGLLFTGVLGVLMMTSECTSGMIRATFTAVPRRPLVLAAKAGVFGTVALAAGEAAAFISFVAGGAALRHGIAAPSLSQPGVLRSVVLAGASFSLIGLLGLGLGAIIWHTAAAIAVLVGGGGVPGGTVRRRRGAARGDVHAGADHRELADRHQAGDLPAAREREVLALMAEGRSNAGVAAALVISAGAVEKHVASIFAKLGLPASEADNRRVLAVLRYVGG
jgi:ABC-2 type transport system permease protein